MFDLSACGVERTANRDYRIFWRCQDSGQPVAIYMADDPAGFYAGQLPDTPLARATGNEARLVNPDPYHRHYFYLESAQGEGVILAERWLDLEGTANFRDLGGYQGEGGRPLKWGKLYRSSKLSRLSEQDRQRVKRLGLTLVCDFRQVIEQELEPTLLDDDHPHVLASLPVSPGSHNNFLDNLHNGILAVDDASAFMQQLNRELVASQMPRYAEMFQLLLKGDEQVLIHCASGKDRTGFGAALILDVLGVEEEAIVEDYLLTNRYLPIDSEIERLSQALRDSSGEAPTEAVLRPLLEVRPEYIRACFDEIRRHFRSRDHFYQTALQLEAPDRERLQETFLQ